MADYYIDVVSGASANSGATPALAKQYISQATVTAGNRVLLKAGQVHPIGAYCFFGSNTILTSYGDGAKPILQKTAGTDAYVYVRNCSNVLLENFAVDGNGFNASLIAMSVTSADTTGITLRNVDLYGSANAHGLFMSGDATYSVNSITIESCTFHDNALHGAMAGRHTKGIVYKNCIAYRNGLVGDGHGFTSFSTATPYPEGINYYFCEAYDNVDSSATQIEGTGFQFDDNTHHSTMIGCLSHGNEGSGFCFNVGSSNRAIGCIAYENEGAGILLLSNTGAVLSNNVFDGNCRASAYYAAEVVLRTTSTGATINNNIFINSDTLNPKGLDVDAGSVSGSAAATNCIYGFTTAASGVTPSGTVTSDPLLISGYRLSSGSPCVGTGTVTVARGDRYGKEFKTPPDIGAVNYYPTRSITIRDVNSGSPIAG